MGNGKWEKGKGKREKGKGKREKGKGDDVDADSFYQDF